ncbi:tetratricopeptide repeat protein 17 [Achroia grisella]|uniref:tetratricopeptide repeat protein 17 n=1 Tax=Achroia grisella TaxID=688607 RepID=UPI0027D33C6B|nr:tetratricopeptide repeat protein 17 [Achroia grisella]
MKFIRILWVFCWCSIEIHGTTHWMVTESGLIQPRVDSPFEMVNPHDLLAFLNQDTRWDNIINLYQELFLRQKLINKLWKEVETGIDVDTLLSIDPNCIKAEPLDSIDWYGTVLEDSQTKYIVEKELSHYYPANNKNIDVPDCKKISSLTFSMFAFEHLEGMIHRENLSSNVALLLPEQIETVMTDEQLGDWAATTLRKNSSSWLHYNVASLYWRIKGKAPKALECSRRAVHYAPRIYKDIALLSLGSILHLSRKTEDAVTILSAAVEHDPLCPFNHFVLANAYAVIGDFKSSLKHLDLCLKLNPAFHLARTHKYGALCHAKLVETLKKVKETMAALRVELKEFYGRELHWLKSHVAFLRTRIHDEEFDYSNVEKNCEKISELTGLNIKQLKKQGDKNYIMKYFLDGTDYKAPEEKGTLAIEWAHSLKRWLKHVENRAKLEPTLKQKRSKLSEVNIKKGIGSVLVFSNGENNAKDAVFRERSIEQKSSGSRSKNLEFKRGPLLYPPTLKIDRNIEDFDREPDWPSNKVCKNTAANIPDKLDAIFPVFLPFENKGLSMTELLTDKIGVPANVEHDVPWHPPICPQDKDSAAFIGKKSQKQQMVTEVRNAKYLRQKLLEYVGDGDVEIVKRMQDAEIGQRIYAAMDMELAPKWVTYTLASLYWRVRGNNANALNCLLTANKIVEQKYKDIVLVPLASLYIEMGYFDDALNAAEAAFKINLYEPATNFLLAELNMLKKHRNTHMFHLKQVIRLEPSFMDGLARNLLNGWACILKEIHSVQELEQKDGDSCTQVEPGMSMVCEKGGINCHMTNVQCINSQERESSTLLRMLELKDDNVKRPSDKMDDSIFDDFIDNMPPQRTMKRAHEVNYETMMQVVGTALQGCGPRGCNDIQPDDLAMKEEDCTHQQLQLGYWLHIFCFKQLFTDANLKFPAEITTMNPSSKKIPECRLFEPSEDFYLDRLSRVDTDGWEPLLTLMHQFAEMFNFHDFVTLGSKIARYVDSKPRSWAGAVAAAWWCGAAGRGACTARCLAAALTLAPAHRLSHTLRPLVALLHMQSKQKDAKEISYLIFYMQPKSKIEAFLVAVSHTYLEEYEQAVWMYRYALTFDDKFLPAKACLHATMCLMLFGENYMAKIKDYLDN